MALRTTLAIGESMTAVTEEKAPTVAPANRAEQERTKDARLALVGESAVDKKVRVKTLACGYERPGEVVGQVGWLQSIDQSDPNRLYYVDSIGLAERNKEDTAENRLRWVYDVEVVDEPVHPVTVLGPVDGPVEKGDRVKVLGCLEGATDDFRGHVIGSIVEVMDGQIDGPNLHLLVRLAEPFRADGEVLTSSPITSWAKVLEPGTTFSDAQVAEMTAPAAEVDPKDAEITTLREQLAAARRGESRAAQALETLKEDVGRTAMKYAKQHGWCAVVKDALSDVGIDAPSLRKRIVVTYEFTLEAECTSNSEPDEEFVRRSLSEPDYPSLDSDWENVSEIECSRESVSIEDADD